VDCSNLGKTANNQNSEGAFSRNTSVFLFETAVMGLCRKVLLEKTKMGAMQIKVCRHPEFLCMNL
jgi:hypothetical protein